MQVTKMQVGGDALAHIGSGEAAALDHPESGTEHAVHIRVYDEEIKSSRLAVIECTRTGSSVGIDADPAGWVLRHCQLKRCETQAEHEQQSVARDAAPSSVGLT
jgi:hypothetical protein